MGKEKKDKKSRRHEPLADQMERDTHAQPKKGKRAQAPGDDHEDEEFVSSHMSRRILKEAKEQREELWREDKKKSKTQNAHGMRGGGAAADDEFDDEQADGAFSEDEEEYYAAGDMAEEEVQELNEEEMAAMRMFFQEENTEAGAGPTLADIILAKIKEKEVGVQGEAQGRATEQFEGIHPKVIAVYQSVGQLLHRYRAGKLPKAFKIVPSLRNWEDILYITAPYDWSPQATFAATRIFASNLNAKMAQRFFSVFLLPHVRSDIFENKRLNYHLYQALKKAVFKPAAFFKGIVIPLCESGASLREAVILASVLRKVSIPVVHSAVALMKLAELPYTGATSVIMRAIIDKKYSMPFQAIDAVVAHFARFEEMEETLPVLWHLCMLTFVQRYKHQLTQEEKEALRAVLRVHTHHGITPEVHRELAQSRCRGEKAAGHDDDADMMV